jgi:hypothetical protein
MQVATKREAVLTKDRRLDIVGGILSRKESILRTPQNDKL